jgi:DNA repair exonuclease SbcCD ATPase subunit
MNIVFEEVEYKNFMKVGNQSIKIQLNKDPLTLLSGKNGAGKTTVLSAILFALFGRTERKVNKPQLINSINQKNSLVTLSFVINSSDRYIISRGLKPNIFQISRNGKDLDEESSIRIDQEYLENNILKMNFKTFTQICLLSSSNFVAFFALPIAGKRQIIDDILGISVFSEMKLLLKSKIDELKEEQQSIIQKIEMERERVSFQSKSLDEIEVKLDSSITEKQEAVNSLLQESEAKTAEIKLLQKQYDQLNEDFIFRRKDAEIQLKTIDDKIKSQMHTVKEIVKKMKFFDSTNVCPTCFQEIDEIQKKKYASDIKTDVTELNNSLEANRARFSQEQSYYNEMLKEQVGISKKQKDISQKQLELSHLLQHIRIIEKEISEINTKDNILYSHKISLQKSIKQSEKTIVSLEKDLSNKKSELIHHHFIGDMLKDDGIKTRVIKYYLPIINSLMEKYLDLFSFFVSFNLDDNFNEVIKERHYSQFSYDSFSEGEKSRLNLAILFTFRELIKIRNTAHVNLLFLDEIFQSSLDEQGKIVLMEVLKTLSSNGENIFVISHDKDIVEGGEFEFSRTLEFSVKNNFSTYREAIAE